MFNHPKIIYKYRDWENEYHRRSLTQNQLYFAPPSSFNDPFDCRIPDNIFSLDTDDKLRRYTDLVMIKTRDRIHEKGLNMEEERIKFYEELKKDPSIHHNKLEKVLFEKQDLHIGVISFSAIWDNILMWSHYAANHTGFCIGIYEEKLRNSGLTGAGGMVNYDKELDYPLIDPLNEDAVEKSLLRTQNKAKSWSYEQEYRVMKTYFPKVANKEDRTIQLPDDFYSEVILGLDFPESSIDEIVTIAQKKKLMSTKHVRFLLNLKLTENNSVSTSS